MEIANTDLEKIIELNIGLYMKTINNSQIYEMLF